MITYDKYENYIFNINPLVQLKICFKDLILKICKKAVFKLVREPVITSSEIQSISCKKDLSQLNLSEGEFVKYLLKLGLPDAITPINFILRLSPSCACKPMRFADTCDLNRIMLKIELSSRFNMNVTWSQREVIFNKRL